MSACCCCSEACCAGRASSVEQLQVTLDSIKAQHASSRAAFEEVQSPLHAAAAAAAAATGLQDELGLWAFTASPHELTRPA